MLLSLAGSATPAATPTSPKPGGTDTVANVVALRPTPRFDAETATPNAIAPVGDARDSAVARRILQSQDYQVLLQAQARAQRDADLKRLGMTAANETFQSVTRGMEAAIEQGDAATLRNGVVTLRMRSEAEARLAQQLYDRYQAARSIGATEDEIAQLEARFARIAGWPPLPPVHAERAPGGSLKGIQDAIRMLEEAVKPERAAVA